MKKVILWDQSIIYVTDEQAVKIMRAKQLNKPIQVDMPGGGYEFLSPGAVARITGAGHEVEDRVPEERRIESKVELTDEDRKRNSETLHRMKEDFLKKAAERKEKNEKRSTSKSTS